MLSLKRGDWEICNKLIRAKILPEFAEAACLTEPVKLSQN